jgi:hypothetical protein
MKFRNQFGLTAILLISVLSATVHGQRVTYKRVTVERVVDVPTTETRWVEETAFEPETERRYKQVIQTEQRQRERIVKRPKTVTKYRTERVTRQKPVTIQKFHERKTKETSYKTVKGYRDETYTVREPVIETEMRTERVKVQRPVTKELIEVQRTTTMKPVVSQATAYDVIPGAPLYQAVPDSSRRARLRLLSSGYYTDPVSGATVYRRGGLHWVQPNAAVAVAQTPSLVVPRQVEQIDYKPEVVETRKPITVTRMVEETIEREVPHTVKKFVERTKTRKVPYEYELPVDNVVVEKIPYTETVYRDEVVERQVPYTVTEMEEVRTLETYDVDVPRYVEETVKQEKQVRRWVEKEVSKTERKKILETMKVPVGPDGEALSDPVPLDAHEYEFVYQIPSVSKSTTRKPVVESSLETTESGQEVFQTYGTIVEPPKRTVTNKPTTIEFPETQDEAGPMAPIDTKTPDATKPSPVVETSGKEPTPAGTNDEVNDDKPEASILKKAEMPDVAVSEKTGNEDAAD